MKSRVDEFGRAYAGSQLQIQTYVNRRRAEFDAAIYAALPDLGGSGATLEWVSPLERDRFQEYSDEAFLGTLGLLGLAGELADFWPQRGPQWDALAKVHWSDARSCGVLLVEAKSYPKEMYADGCRASEASRIRIVKSLDAAKQWLGASASDWTGPLYQSANRLAHLYFLRRVCGVPAWFVNVCFCGDPHSPTPAAVWTEALATAKAELGLGGCEVPYCADVLLDAAGRELFQQAAPVYAGPSIAGANGPGKEWRFLRNDRTSRHQFLAFANARGSSSLRYFDAESGMLLGEPRYGRKRRYQGAFALELAASQPVAGPRSVSNEQIPAADLADLRAQVGLGPATPSASPAARRSSILAGVDEIVDNSLGVMHIGTTAPHYRHLGAYRAVVASPPINGQTLVCAMYQRILSNWPGTSCRSAENWRWEKKTYIAERNESPEKRFEKTLAAECADWYNMIPVASGVLPDVEEGGRRIDLVRQCGPGWFEFVELKMGEHCDTPLYAAIEILGYGLVYLFSRLHAERLGYDRKNRLLAARQISLKVLAPAEAYAAGCLMSFEHEINRGLLALCAEADQSGFQIDFQFEQFPAGVADFQHRTPSEYVARRKRVYGTTDTL